MTEQQSLTRVAHQWMVYVSLMLGILTLLLTFAGPRLWLLIPAMAALTLGLVAAIKNPVLRTPAGIACVIAALAGGVNILLG